MSNNNDLDLDEKVDLSMPPPPKSNANLSWIDIFPPVFRMNDRSIRYKILLDVIPSWATIMVMIIVFLLMIIALIIGMLAVPQAEWYVAKHNAIDANVFLRGAPVYHEISGVSNTNLDLFFEIYFGFNGTVTDISKSDLKFTVRLEGRNNDAELWKEVQANTTITRILQCYAGTRYYFSVPAPGGGHVATAFDSCEKMTLQHLNEIKYPLYRSSLSIHNAQDMFSKGLLEGDIITEFQTTSASFSIFECVFRVIFASYSAFSWVLFSIVVVKCQQFSKWHTTQKWLPILLFLQIFYHDPIYWVQILAGGQVWGFYSSFFSLTFIYMFLLFMLIFVHSLFVKPADRSILLFFIPKILLVAVCWIASMIVILWSRYYNNSNPSSIRVEDVPGYQYFQTLVIGLLIVYGLVFLYYLFRGVGNLSRFRDKYSNRFKVVGFFSIFVILAFTGVTLIQGRTRYTEQGFTFLVGHTIVFLYFNVVAILSLPSGVPEPEKIEDKKLATGVDSAVPQDDHFANTTSEIPVYTGDDHVLQGVEEQHKVAEVQDNDFSRPDTQDLSDVNLSEQKSSSLIDLQ